MRRSTKILALVGSHLFALVAGAWGGSAVTEHGLPGPVSTLVALGYSAEQTRLPIAQGSLDHARASAGRHLDVLTTLPSVQLRQHANGRGFTPPWRIVRSGMANRLPQLVTPSKQLRFAKRRV